MKKIRIRPILAAVVASFFVFGLVGVIMAATSVGLGAADDYAVLAGSGITNTGSSVINGDMGLSPGSAVSGFLPGIVNGTQHITDAAAALAQLALTSAYNNAAGQLPVATVPTELGGTTKNAGIYDSAAGTLGITGTLTLDAQGDPNAVFIFKAASTLTTAGSSNVNLINGAQACNIFWQVGSSATLGTNSTFKGNILALSAITLTTGANVEGRVLARNGAVILDGNIVTKATCALPPGVSSVVTGGGVPPLINVTKTPDPFTLPVGGGSVTYTYKVKNIGTVPMNQVLLSDDKCSSQSMRFVGSDRGDRIGLLTTVDSGTWLTMNETWTYSCTTRIAQTTSNTATASGSANDVRAADTAIATVVVGLPTPPPLIRVVKMPSVFALSAPGGAVTYRYTVTNPGTVPLSDVSVIDDKCIGLPGRVVGHPGDLNQNNLLESNEAWSFTCQSYLTQTTTNTATAEGHANGLTAIDYALATVVVSPGFPNTGLPADGRGTLWNIIVLSGILVAVSALFVVVRRII